MRVAENGHRTPSGHEGLLRPRTEDGRAGRAVESWFRSVADRGHKMLTVAAPPRPDAALPGATAVAPRELHPSTAPVRLVHRAHDEGFPGLGILIWADGVIAETSGEYHDGIETALTTLCADHPVSVLCVYDRPGVGTECLDLAAAHHQGGLQEQQFTLRRTGDTVHLSGEVDMTNLDVLDAALRATAPARGGPLRLDLSGLTFLSAGAAHLLGENVDALRTDGADVELHGAAPHVRRVLQLVGFDQRSTS